MAISIDQLASMNFGYITGLNLMQYCPDQMLIQKYNVSPFLFQQGVNQAYSELKLRLSNIYEIETEISSRNTLLENQTGLAVISILANTYLSKIHIAPASQIDTSITSTISIGTTSGGDDVLASQEIGDGITFVANKYFPTQSNIYINISGPAVDVKVIATASSFPFSDVNPLDQLNQGMVKNDSLVEILSKLAIKKILGSSAATNKQMAEIFEENEDKIIKIETKQWSLDLPQAFSTIASLPRTINSSFKTIG